MHAPPFIDAATIERHLDYPSLTGALRGAFLSPPAIPQRIALPIPATAQAPEGFLLVMPAVRPGGLIVVKLVTTHPSLRDRPGGALRAVVLALDAASGETLGLIDGHAMTTRRTAAASVVAAGALARPGARRCCVLGGGPVAEGLAEAYARCLPIDTVEVWARRPEAAQAIVARLREKGLPAAVAADLAEAVGRADIVSSATLAATPFLLGAMVGPGTHVDLVGGFNRTMREADDALVTKARIVVDGPAAFEAGDLAFPLDHGLIRRDDIRELGEVLADPPARGDDEITLFKSAGLALEDLVAAELLFERLHAPQSRKSA